MTDLSREIENRLREYGDEEYRRFQAKLMPGVPTERIIGVRTPILRKLSKEYARLDGIDDFLTDLPHPYYDENNLHGFIVSECRDYRRTVEYTDAFLPQIDNWATCDLFSPKVFVKHRAELADEIGRWLASDRTFTVRFAIEMIQTHYLDGDFDKKWLDTVAGVRSGEYYINMMTAWFFATALTKQWDSAVVYIEQGTLDEWTHNKAIQKARESRCISDERKLYLSSLKR